VGAVVGFLEKGLAHFTAERVDLDAIVETRLFPDMLPSRFQLQSVAHHSLGAIDGVKRGLFQPPPQAPAYDYRGLQQLVADAARLHGADAAQDLIRARGSPPRRVRCCPTAPRGRTAARA
jgi:hypothetical protein